MQKLLEMKNRMLAKTQQQSEQILKDDAASQSVGVVGIDWWWYRRSLLRRYWGAFCTGGGVRLKAR